MAETAVLAELAVGGLNLFACYFKDMKDIILISSMSCSKIQYCLVF